MTNVFKIQKLLMRGRCGSCPISPPSITRKHLPGTRIHEYQGHTLYCANHHKVAFRCLERQCDGEVVQLSNEAVWPKLVDVCLVSPFFPIPMTLWRLCLHAFVPAVPLPHPILPPFSSRHLNILPVIKSPWYAVSFGSTWEHLVCCLILVALSR